MVTAVAPSLAKTVYADEENVLLFGTDFEDGDINAWASFGGGGALYLDETNGHSGEKSLKATERSEPYNGPSMSLDSIFSVNQSYDLSVWVYHETGGEKNISWTVRYVDSFGLPNYTGISADVKSGEWTQIAGTIEIPDDAVSFLSYFECSNATADFNIDDVEIYGQAPIIDDSATQNKKYDYLFDFEKSNEFWGPRGDNRLIRTDEYSYTGSHALYLTGRTKTWNGPTVSIDNLERGVEYFFSAYIMYNGQEYEDKHDFRIELQYNYNSETVYQLIKQKEIKKDYWTRITGTYVLPADAKDVSFYAQTANNDNPDENDLMSFYIDNVSIAKSYVIHKDTALKSFIILIIATAAAIIMYFIIKKIMISSKRKKAALQHVSKDAMTKAFNRNTYEKKIAALEENPELCRSLYFALCDVNFLKYLNDCHGHEKGDEAIIRCAQLLMKTVGNDGEVYRTGGDEFVCITRKPMQEKIRDAIDAESKNDKGYPFEVASGFAEYDTELDSETPDIKAIIERCDQEMYANKQEIKSKNKEFSRS